MRRAAILAAAAALSGCSANMPLDGFTDATFGGPDDVPPGTLRVDVFPPSTEDALLPQSFGLYAAGESYPPSAWRLAPTAVLDGTLSGRVIRGWSAAPSEIVPLPGRLDAVSHPGFLQAGAARAGVGEDGNSRFEMAVPGNATYALAVVPADATAAAFSLEVIDVEASANLSRVLEPGAPVYGRATDAAGAGVEGVRMRIALPARDLADVGAEGVVAGAESEEFETGADGWSLARALPGQAYVLEVLTTTLADGRVVPSTTVEFAVADDNGAAVDVGLGALARASVSGLVVDADGEPVQATVRARGRALDEGEGTVDIVHEIDRDDDGAFTVQLAPGTYDIEFVPGSRGATPVRLRDVAVDGSTTLGRVTLGAGTPLSGLVTDAEGMPVAGAAVNVSRSASERRSTRP